MSHNCSDLKKQKCNVLTNCTWELKPLELGKKRRTGHCINKQSTLKTVIVKVGKSTKSNMVLPSKAVKSTKSNMVLQSNAVKSTKSNMGLQSKAVNSKKSKMGLQSKAVNSKKSKMGVIQKSNSMTNLNNDTQNTNSIPFKYIGNYNTKDPLTTIKGYADKNKSALVLYSANTNNYGPWNRTRTIGYGQATNVHSDTLWAKQTYGIFAGPFAKKGEALKTIKNSLNTAFKYFHKNKDRFSHIAHPGTDTNTGYYGGIWSKFMSKEDRLWLNKSIIEYINTRINIV